MEVPEPDEAVRRYVDAVAPEYRALFDRVHLLIMGLYPEADVALSYAMPTYQVGTNRLHVGVWKHGVSLYGWEQECATDFVARHPQTRSGRATIRLWPEDSADATDDELRNLIRGALDR